MAGYTVGVGTTISSGRLIPSQVGAGYSLTNNGVIGSTTASAGVLAVPAGVLVFNNTRIIANPASGTGVSLEQGGYVQNASGATITGYRALLASSAAGTVMNTGSILSSGAVFGVRLSDGGLLINNQNGDIHGGYGGVYIGGASGDVHNSGTAGGGVAGVFLRGGGFVGNYKTGVINANYAVAIGGGLGLVTNTGLINGGKLGVEESAGGNVVNSPGATINGALGVHIFGGTANVHNFGTINAGASGTAVALAAGFNNRLAIYPGSTIVGTVTGGNTIGSTATSVLQLGTESAVGTLTGIGSKYLNFTSIYEVPFASWVIGASIPSGMTLTVDGTLDNLGIVHTTATLGSGAVLTNSGGAAITASHDGVLATAALATVVNDGMIRATAGVSYGVHFTDGGTVTNQSQGTITGATALFLSGTVATVVNMGQILGANTTDFEVLLSAGGTIQNLGGTIDGGAGVFIEGGAATVVNTGKIAAENANPVALELAPGFADQLSIAPGAVFGGMVDGGNTLGAAVVSSLVLASGASTGTITGIGSSYVNFGNFVVNAGATWVMNADWIPFAATLTDNGVLTNNGTIGTTVTLGASAALINARGANINALPNAVYDNAGFAAVTNDGAMGGVDLKLGGNVTNQSAGVINGPVGVQISGGGGSVVNAGTIIGDNGKAVLLPAGGVNEVVFGAGAKFTGVVNGGNPVGSGPVSTLLLNTGSAIGTLNGLGTQYLNFGNLVVAPGASWVLAGNQMIGAAYTVTDNGALTNHDIVQTSVTLGSGASLTNAADGVINGGAAPGVFDAGSGRVVNYGSITGKYAVSLGAGGNVTNRAGYLGGLYGVYIRKGAGTVTNFAEIEANEIGKKAVSLAPGYYNRVVVGAGARFVGVVDGGNANSSTVVSTLELATGAGAGVVGMMNGIGSEYLNFELFVVDPGASWVIGGNQTIAASDALTDNGTLINNATVLSGVLLGNGASLTNDKGVTISSAQFAVIGDTGPGTVVNDGLISGYDSVALFEGGTFTNQSDGTIVGQASLGAGAIGLTINGGTVTNSGLITGGPSGGGVSLRGGTVINLAGTISGGIGVKGFFAADTVANFATIVGTGGTAVSLLAGLTNRMVIGAGAVFSGEVDGGNTIGSATVSTLELTTGASAGVVGTLSGIGSKYVNFTDIVVDAGASWVFAGGQTIVANQTLIDNGTLTNHATVLTTVTLGSGASLTNSSSVISLGGFVDGVDAAGPATLSNYGVIVGGGAGFGVEMSAGGVITNHAGTISAASGILIFGEAGTVTNYGEILGVASRTGVQLSAGGTIINRSGTISGGSGTEIFAGGTVVNYATILGLSGGIDAAHFGSGFRNLLEIAPGSTIVGGASGGNTIGATAVSTLELITGTAAGVIGTVGVIGTYGQASANYVNFADIVVDAGASWAFKNTQTLAANETLTDNGTLTNNGVVLTPVTLGAGGTVINAQGAQISDFGFTFIYAVHDSGAGVVVNDGLIAGGAHDGGVGLYGGGTVTNQAQGTITAAAYAGVGIFGAPGTVINNGVIQGGDNGVFFSAGGTIVNLAGTIGAARFDGVGIYSGPGTVVNFATIVGGTLNGGAVYLSSNFADRVVIGAGAVFTGAVSGGNTIGSTVASTLELTTGASAGVIGTIGGIGSHYVDFADIVVDPGASWVVAATQTLAAGYTLTDNGTLTNDGTLLTAVTIGSAARLTNAQGAVVEGGQLGVIASGGPATVVNNGLISAFSSGSVGVDLAGGGAVTNQTNGVIAGYFGVAGYNATVVNAGFISGIADAVELVTGGAVTNSAGGRISGRSGVVITGGAGTVVNSGLIGEFSSHSYGISLPGGFANRVVDNPGASFAGVVDGGNPVAGFAISTLELGAGTQAGTLSGFGSQFINFSAVTVDPGATWSFTGQNDIAAGATLTDAGTLALNGQLQVDGALTETSHLLTVGQGGTGELLIENQGVVKSTQPASPSVGLDIGRGAGDAGNIIVTGSQARLLSAGQFVVGDGGSGSLEIRSGATVQTTSGGVAGRAGAVIANGTGASGSSVNVAGAGSDWQVGGALIVGNAGDGALDITSGGTVSATTLDIGSQSDSSGNVSVSGDNSNLIVTGSLAVGDAGSGEFSVLGAANATIGGDLDFGQTSGGSGNIDLETNGTVFVGGGLNFGAGGPGVLTLGPSTDLILTGGINGGPGAVLNLFNTIDPAPYSDNSTDNISGAFNKVQTQAYPAYVAATAFNLSHGVTYTLDTPVVYSASSFTIGGSGDTTTSTLILNADSLSTDSGITFNNAHGTLVVGIDQLATIDVPATGTGPFTTEQNPNLGQFLLGAFDGTISGFQSGDQIKVDTDLASPSDGTLSRNGALVSVIDIANGHTLGVLTFDSEAHATAAIADGAITLTPAPCFAAGTKISTDRGEVAVETIGVGDKIRVLLAQGSAGDGFAEVIWVGHREVHCAHHATPRKVWPVRVSAGAFGPGQPHTDLYLSPDHAVYIETVLIPVRCLINGSTIQQVPVDRVTYHHIELTQHDVLLAQGLPAESFLDMRDGTNYANRPGPIRLYPDYSTRIWEAFGCARLVVTGSELEAARALVASFARTSDTGPAAVQKAA